MKIYQAFELFPGMVVFEDVMLEEGRTVLLHAGQELDDKLIHTLMQRGIKEVCIDEQNETDPGAAEKKEIRSVPVIGISVPQDQMTASVSVAPASSDDLPVSESMIKDALIAKDAHRTSGKHADFFPHKTRRKKNRPRDHAHGSYCIGNSFQSIACTAQRIAGWF